MFTTGRIRRLAVLAPVAALALIFACSDSGTDGPPVEGDCTTLTAQANAALAALMQGDIDSIINHGDSTFRPHDVDFSIPHGLYQQALAADPNCADAKMGAAFTGVLMFMTDADFNSLVEKFKHAYDTLTFNPMRPNSLAPAVGFGGDILTDAIPLKAGRFTGLIPSPLELDRAALRLAAVDPDLTALQDRLEESLLPKIRSARTRLLDLVADPDYTFEITPAMQGNEGAEPVLLDRSDIQLFIAMTYAAEAGLEVFFARNLSLSAYTTAGVEEALARTSEFLSLKSGGVGTQHMGNAKQCVLDAVNALKTAIGYLRAEIDTYQPYDFIEVYEEDRDDLQDAENVADSVLDYFTGPRPLQVTFNREWECVWVVDHDSCYWVEDTLLLDVDIAEFFDNPITNYKLFVPLYTVTVDPLNDLYKAHAAAHFSRARYWTALGALHGITAPNDAAYFGYHLPDGDTDEFYRFLAEWPQSHQTVFGWDDVENWCGPGDTNLTCYFSLNAQNRYERYWDSPDQILACYDWAAADFGSWTFPNPTMNGLLPGMTSDRLKEIWSVDLGFPWYPSQCDTLGFDF